MVGEHLLLSSMKKILIIEDNAEIRENTAELLELNKYKVLTAADGNEGFEKAKKHMPDLILCDMMMPETDGTKFLKMAKQNDAIQNIPIVFFSAGTPFPHIQKALMKASNGFLKKPFSEEELLKTISNIVGAA